MPFTAEEMRTYCNGVFEYMPTPEDIRRECAKIRRGWSARDRLNRLSSSFRSKHATIPTISIREFDLGFQRLIESEDKCH